MAYFFSYFDYQYYDYDDCDDDKDHPQRTIRGGIKKTVFFRKNSEILRPPPPSSSLEAPVFSDKEILELARPPPLLAKNSEIFSVFYDKIPMDWVRPPLLAKISKNPHFL